MIKLLIYHIFNPILVSLAIKILSWEPPKGKPNPVRARVTRKLAVPEALQEVIPPIKIEVASILSGAFSLSVAHQSIINWAYAMACYFYPLLDALPVHLSNVWVVDETYLRYEGKWGHLFTVLDGEHGSILAFVLQLSASL